jgi:hypothetical protein
LLTNEDYFERWEASAPTPVAGTMTPEEIQATQGTRLRDDVAPWETYGKQLEQDDPALLAAIEEYASRVSDAEASSQTKEEYLRLKEGADEQVQAYRWVSPEEYKNEGARIGRIMHSSVFIKKLRDAGVKCWYRAHPQPGKVTLIIQLGELPAEVGCWCQLGFSPELSIMRFDEHGVPTTEKYRGWRTGLLQLILKSALSQEKAEEVFGKAPVTPEFNRYNATLQMFRNAGNRLEK